jgi:hypothetical protein
VRDDETRAGRPGVHGEAALAPQLAHAFAIDDVEGETELALELVLPLHDHRRRCGNHDQIDAPSQEKLARDKPGFDGFAETDVVRDQQIDARQPQGFAQGQQLVGIKPDAGPERGLQQIAVGRGGGLPADRAQIRGQDFRTIWRAAPNLGPGVVLDNPGADLTGRAGYCRLAPLFLSNTASIGPSGTMLSLRLSDGAYKLEALPPSRNRALGQFSPSRNRRAKASNDTSP